ncbi:MAG: FG-GAP repeat protein [Rhodothermales bacterium]|nr:FG-GAP repeat protein [Rhodothermales bacterium]MBO6779152.1 FG-GAP repeat protein [Rhodothermales bacterium]
MRLHARFARICAVAVLALSAAGPVQGQIQRLPPADTTTANFFGSAVALDGERLLVGSSGSDTCGPNSGAAFVYELQPNGTWAKTAHLEAADCEPGEFFGRAVALEADVAVVTSFVPTPFAARSNAVYVFELDEYGSWRQAARLTDPVPAEDGPFAASVSIDSGRILVTSTGDTASGRFGGTASLFARNSSGRWAPEARFSAPHDARFGVFGTSASLDGDRAVVTASTYGLGAPGSAHVFEERGGRWVRTTRIDGVDDYFIPVQLDGARLVMGQTRDGSGRAVIYELRDEAWVEAAELRPSSPYPGGGFGSAVALSGDTAAVVGFDEQLKLEFNIDRVVFVFRRQEDGTWKQTRIVDVGEVYFGAALDLEGDTAVIGRASDEEAGGVYVATVF